MTEAHRLGYRPHSAARALASGRTRIVLLVVPDWPLDYSMRTNLDEASLALDQAGYSLVTMTSHSGGQAQPLWRTLDPDVVMGMTPFTPEQLEDIRASGVEHVVQGEAPTPAQSPAFAQGPRLQVEHLLDRGRTRLAFAGTRDPRLSNLVEERRTLSRATVQDRLGGELLVDQDIDETSASDFVATLTAERVDGVVAYNDDIAAMVVGAALRAGVSIPGQIAVVGHDDTPLASLFVPALSSVHVDTAGLGRYLAELALSVINAETAPVPPSESDTRVIARETT
jgi:DNA-binding LacI/PurR family transcriptional regulator